MKRYRVLSLQLDSRPGWLQHPPWESWTDGEKGKYLASQERIRDKLRATYGTEDFEQKEMNFIELGVMPISILAFHNKFLTQARNAFVLGSYYPALTGACALGERLLNHLMLSLRDDFKGTPEYKRVFSKKSFDGWDLMIDTLSAWNVLALSAADSCRTLNKTRNNAIHFRPDTDTNDRALAKEAIRQLEEVIALQFPFMGRQPWFLNGVKGESYIKKDWETHPFIQKVYLPNCALLGPGHSLKMEPGTSTPRDWLYEEREISDHEFCEMRNKHLQMSVDHPEINA